MATIRFVETVSVGTGSGPVELAARGLDRPTVLICPGGHCDASADVGADLFTDLGFGVVTVSRPGYGQTDVGPLTAAQFVAPLTEALHELGVVSLSAVVGVSFGGLLAVEFARAGSPKPERLILASAAPSSLPYPDSVRDRLVGPVAFSSAVQSVTWAMVRRLVKSEWGLRLMAGSLSRLPAGTWWPQWTVGDKARCRALFSTMDSGSGFVCDLRQASRAKSAARHSSFAAVDVPTLVLGSRFDAGVRFAHAEDEARVIPDARLVQTNAPSHLFWLGPGRGRVLQALRDFLPAANA